MQSQMICFLAQASNCVFPSYTIIICATFAVTFITYFLGRTEKSPSLWILAVISIILLPVPLLSAIFALCSSEIVSTMLKMQNHRNGFRYYALILLFSTYLILFLAYLSSIIIYIIDYIRKESIKRPHGI